MRFDAGRLAQLAGLSQESSGLLREGAHDKDEEVNLDLFEAEGDEEGHEGEMDESIDDILDDDVDPPGIDEISAGSGDDEIVTVDENTLRREIMKMKQQRLAESKIRKAVRQEIAAILSEEYDDDDLYLTSDWLYGDNKPRNSRKGTVATALPGLGFKKI